MRNEKKSPNKNREDKLSPGRFRRAELDHYTTEEMDLYLFFQNHGKYPTSTPLT